MKPAKVKFHPLPVKEETILAKYMDGTYTGIWKDWFDQNFRDLMILQRNYDAMVKEYYSKPSAGVYYYWSNGLPKIEAEIIEAARLAGPYLLHREAQNGI